MASPKDAAVTRQVLGYFVRNPEAVDSLEGITRWRLLEETIHQQVKATQEAINWLVERGVLEQKQGPGLPPLFSLDPAHKDDAERLLAELARNQ